jgi:hypothetical protein
MLQGGQDVVGGLVKPTVVPVDQPEELSEPIRAWWAKLEYDAFESESGIAW